MIRCTFWRLAPRSRASHATGCGRSEATMAPRICHRALVSPSLATRRSPAAKSRLLSLNRSSMRFVRASPASVLLDFRICHHDVILTSSCQYTKPYRTRLTTYNHIEEPVMSLLRPLDPGFPIERQIAIEAAPVVLVNVCTLDKADEQTFLQAWQNDAAFMKQQPGFISTQL